MADAELSRVLKDLPNRLQTASVNDRKQITQDIVNVLSNEGITENIVRGVCRSLFLVLPRYRDRKSLLFVHNLISSLLKHHFEWTKTHLLAVLSDFGEQLKNTVPTKYIAQVGLTALNWSCLILESAAVTKQSNENATSDNQSSECLKKTVEQLAPVQTVLFTIVISVGNTKLNQRAEQLIAGTYKLWQVHSEIYLQTLSQNFEPAIPDVVVFGACIGKILSKNNNGPVMDKYKDKFLDIFIKTLVTCKTKPSREIVEACYPLLKTLSHDQFKNILLPALQKAMLRSPEVILECVGLILSGVAIDLSRYAKDIGKSLTANLYSQNELVREEAVDGCKRLAMRCGKSDAIESLLVQIFDIFNGSNGKLNILEHKLNVLKAAGNLTENNINSPNLAETASEHFFKVLETEVNETCLCFTLKQLSKWCQKFVKEIPKSVIAGLKKGMELKTSTPNVRVVYIECMLMCFNKTTINQAADLIPVLIKSVERAVAQSTQASTVTEGLCAARLLLRISKADANTATKMQPLWNIIYDMDKQIFISEKYLTVASEDALLHVVLLCETLLLEHAPKLSGGREQPIYKAIIHATSLTSYSVRKQALLSIKQLIAAPKSAGTIHASALLAEVANHLQTLKIPNNRDNENTKFNPNVFIEIITSICSRTNLAVKDAYQLALNSLQATHHPAIVQSSPNLWRSVLKYIKVEYKKFITMYIKQIAKTYIDEYTATNTNENIISTLVAITPELILPQLIQTVTTRFRQPELLQITRDDYFTFLTPEGELYDKSVIPGNDENNIEINIKRESKAYSYKEQQEEIALRRELMEKKKKEGKLTEPQYTPKQLEAIKMQREKEAGIRNRLQEINTKLLNTVSLIKAASQGNSIEFSTHLRDLIPSILGALQSPLAAPILTTLYIDLHHRIFPKHLQCLGNLIGHVTLRLIKPACDLDTNWDEEELNGAVLRTISQIYDVTNPKIPNGTHFTAPMICYTFPMFKISLLLLEIRVEEKIVHDSLQIISEHAKLRGRTIEQDLANANQRDLYHPKLLPHKQMFELLIELISCTSDQKRIQSQAVACLLDVARCCGGSDDTCARASESELSVLLTALQNPSENVRDAALRALQLMVATIPTPKENKDLSAAIVRRVWISKFDNNEDIRALAKSLWDEANLEITTNLCELVILDIQHPVECIQNAAARSLRALLETEIQTNPKKIDTILQRLLNIYKDKLTIIPPTLDNFGRVIEQPVDLWGPRRGVALALKQLAPLISPDSIGKLITFFVKNGLGDRNEDVRAEMLAAALEVVELHGKETISTVLPVFEQFMDKTPKSSSFDSVRQGVVILMGSLAKHLEKDDERLKPIVMRLVSALSTPSQQVQEAVANCLPPLVPAIRDDAPNIVNKLLHQLLKSEKYGDRKGAAYGLAGLVKGMGILALKQLDIMTKLTEAIQDKKNYKHREGALFAFEMLCSMLGRLFEPYIVHVLPHLLLCFGDSSQYVRTATDDTARVVMSKLSAHGVKLVLPSLLAALEEDSWRTKTGSVELLGSMAYCAPKQLSSCLPSIVPKLIEVLSDSHMKVQEAGAEALKVIGSVIRNPEIQAIVPVLLQALQDPSNKTSACLQTLLDTQFVHFIDAPSLALIMPVVQRAFQDRSTETRKMAAQIIGNMYSLTDQKDLKPYLPTIIPGLKTSLLDPVPEVRSVSARALGAMVRGMGEASFEDLLPWLMNTLTSESSSVDRSGAAQGLSEVVAGLGVEKLNKLMPEIISTAERTDIAPHVKDGYIMMFIYLPSAFTQEFTPYIGQIINPILQALADENEYVRDTALKAGQRIVNLYAESAIMLLLPELERGLFDDNWRIRYSSVQLLGDLLYRISGVSGKMSTETASEDDNFGTEQSHHAIIRTLGPERRNRVLAGLYMGRSDVALMVRQAALHVWKVVVTNTPRTLREILPTLFNLLLGCLASTSYDKRQVAARTLGDLVRKLGERVLPEIIPILEEGLQSDQADTRQGVCIGLSEIMASTSRDMVLTFVNSLVPTVRKALCDPLPEVRHAAAKTFDSLHSTVGVKALDDILPAMLNQLNDENPEVVECTLDGLRQVMAIKSRVVLPYLVPQLSAPPVNTKALAILASVAGEALTRFLNKILPALLTALSESHGTPDEAQQLEYCQTVVLSVTDEAGTRTIVDQLLEHTRADCPLRRRSAAALLCAFCGSSKADFSMHIPQLLRGLIHLCIDDDKEVLQMAWEALNAVTKTIEPKQQSLYVADVRQAVRFAVSDMKKESDLIPGFCLPKGIMPILPIFREAILNGDGDEKESAAQGLGEVIRVTSATALQPSVVTITGPLIRILGDRFSWQVKAAVLETLAILLEKVGVMLKQFLPQLQTTFLKALHDPTRQVRLRAAHALGQLIIIHARCDPLFTDLHAGIRNADDPAVRETMLQALRGVITAAGDKMSEGLRKQIHTTLAGMLSYPEDITRNAAAGCFGALTRVLSPEQLADTLNNNILVDNASDDWQLRHGRSAALSVALKEGASVIYTPEYEDSIIRCLLSRLTADRVSIAGSAVRSCGYLLQYLMVNERPLPQNLLVPFVRTMNHNSNDIKQLLARVAIHLAKTVPPEKMTPELLKLLLPTLVNGTKEKNGYVKANSEIALIAVLRLRQGDDVQQRCMSLLDVGARESLADVVSKVLRKVMSQPEGKEEELDDTFIA